MNDDAIVAVVAAILYVGESLDARLGSIDATLSKEDYDYSGIGFQESVARARDLLNMVRGYGEPK